MAVNENTFVLDGGLVHRLGFERALAGVSVFLLAVNVAGDLLLIPRYGAAGCAAVTAAVMFLGAAWTVWRVEHARDRLLGEPSSRATADRDVPDSGTTNAEP